MSDVPSDIHREILSHLPALSLLRFRTVCKAWRRIIDDPSFIRSYSNCQLSPNTLVLIRNSSGIRICSLSLDSLNFADGRQTTVKQLIVAGNSWLPHLPVASCNGLILISDSNIENAWVICNPLTLERLELPLPQPDMGNGIFLVGRGLGYDYAADDYKVVRIDYSRRDGVFVYRTLVYSLKLGSWSVIRDCPYKFSSSRDGVFLNGALHWRSRDMIIVLDIGTGDYGQLSLPPIPTKQERHYLRLDALGGCLVLSYYHLTMKRFDGWAMNDYGVETSWTKLFSLEERDINHAPVVLRPIAYLKRKSPVVLLQYDGGFFWYDVENDSVTKVTIDGVSCISSSQICQESLFRLSDGRTVVANRTEEEAEGEEEG